nr:zincin-like metallopeptidase domain-containing protein [uncultured Methanolobus sp.]
MANKVYTIVTEKILEKLKEGTIPWQKPWNAEPAINYVSRKEYRGINQLLLNRSGEYITWNQIQKLNGKVKKGSKSELVVFFKMLEKENKEGEKDKIPMLRYYRVFHISDIEGIPSISDAQKEEKKTISTCEDIVNNYTEVEIRHNNDDRAFYTPVADVINVPRLSVFISSVEYYSTLFHEMIHSTGHKSRLNRFSGEDQFNFGSHEYSKEELVAEIGSAMLCTIAGIEKHTLDNSAAYIDSWIRALENDHTLIVTAANKAQKASDYILGNIEEEVLN